MRFVTLFAIARLRHRPARWLLVALGVAAATVLPVLASGSASVVAAQAVRYGVGQLDPGQRGLVASMYGLRLDPAALDKINNEVDRQLAPLAAAPPRAELLFGRLAEGASGTYYLAAADDLASAVRITSGRAPRSCTPTRCEVVVLGSGTPTLGADLGLVVVGRAVRRDPLLLRGTFDPGSDTPVLLADGVAQATQLAPLEQFPRTYGWVTPVDLSRVQRLGVDAYLARSTRAAENLMSFGRGVNLDAPDDVLRAEGARAQRSSRRFALLGGSATALLLGFAAIGAIGLRREHTAVTRLLRMRGAPARAVALLTAVESAVPVAAGALVGLAAGALLAAWRGAAAGLPAWHTARAALTGAALAALLGAGIAGILVAAVRSWPAATARAAWRALDLVVLAGLAVVGLALSRGAVTAAGLSDRTDPLLLALPVLFVVCGGLLVGRAWPALVGAGARLLPHAFLAGRLGLLGALRRPLRPVATAAFLAAATGIVVFAAGYQATLRQGATEQAAFAVPLAASVTVGPTLAQPLDLAGMPAYAALAPGAAAHPVLRSDAGIRLSADETLTAQVLGVDPAALTAIPSWNHVVGGVAPARAAKLISMPTDRPGITIAPGATRITLPASGDLSRLTVTGWLRAADGRDRGVALEPDADTVTAAVPPNMTAPVRLFAITVELDTHFTTIQQHHLGEGASGNRALSGRLSLGPPAPAGGADQPAGGWSGWGSTGAQVSTAGDRLTIAYQLNGDRAVVRAGAGALTAPLPVLADPVTAAHAGTRLLPLVMNGDQPVQARVVGTVQRFPTLGTRFLVADAGALAAALDARQPGTGSVTEVWLSAPPASAPALARALSAAPYDQLKVALRADRRARLAADPLARGAGALLEQSALLALLIAALSVALLVVAERRDESTELYAWESDGLPPGTLRLSLFARACAVVAVGVPGGLLIGVALASVTTRLVTVTAVGATPVPPLFLAVGPVWAAAALGVGLGAGLLAAGAVAAGALRERLPGRPEEELW
jgi:hypothetical protein